MCAFRGEHLLNSFVIAVQRDCFTVSSRPTLSVFGASPVLYRPVILRKESMQIVSVTVVAQMRVNEPIPLVVCRKTMQQVATATKWTALLW